jgi:hypothetical protein
MADSNTCDETTPDELIIAPCAQASGLVRAYQWKLVLPDGREVYTASGAQLYTRALGETQPPGPWSPPVKLIFLPEPGMNLLLGAGLLGLAVLAGIRRWWRQ